MQRENLNSYLVAWKLFEKLPETRNIFIEIFKEHRNNFEKEFPKILNTTSLRGAPPKFREAVYYSLLSPGKRLRASISLEVSKLYGMKFLDSMRIASALECVHTYSLVHDDLPVMDNDDFRRGKESNHIIFGESTALLVGDCLQALGFELLADLKGSTELIQYFAKCIGPFGLVGGQFLDLQNRQSNLKTFQKIISLKTGKLFELSVILPLLYLKIRKLLPFQNWGRRLGELFQIADDLADGQKISLNEPSNILKHLSKEQALKKVKNLGMVLGKQAEALFKKSNFLKELPGYVRDSAHVSS